MKLIANDKALKNLRFIVRHFKYEIEDWTADADYREKMEQAVELLIELHSAGRDELLRKSQLDFKEVNAILHATLSYTEENPAHLEENPDELDILESATRKLSELSGRLFESP
tara:strand:- start:653 stop:991 length:339 start_codon:yes stop_codon:yes gene_type:complete